MTVQAMGEFVDLPPGTWSACFCVENGIYGILLVDEAQEPIMLKAMNGQLYMKHLEPVGPVQ